MRRPFVSLAVILLVAITLIWVGYAQTPERQYWFRAKYGLELPTSATFVRNSTVDAGPFGSDSYGCVVVRIDTATAQKWLETKPFCGEAAWRQGPVTLHVPQGDDAVPDEVLSSSGIFY